MARQQEKRETIHSFEQLASMWLEARNELVESEDGDKRIERRTYDDSRYSVIAMALAVRECGLHPEQDPMGWPRKKWREIRTQLGQVRIRKSDVALSPATKKSRVVNIRILFEFAASEGLIPKLPDWGDNFDLVSTETTEEYRYDFQREHGQRVFDLSLARRLLEVCDNAVTRAGLNLNNTSGFRGVSERPNGTFESNIVLKRKGVKTKKYLGVFPTAEEAAEAYRKAALEKGIDVERRMILGRICSPRAATSPATPAAIQRTSPSCISRIWSWATSI